MMGTDEQAEKQKEEQKVASAGDTLCLEAIGGMSMLAGAVTEYCAYLDEIGYRDPDEYNALCEEEFGLEIQSLREAAGTLAALAASQADIVPESAIHLATGSIEPAANALRAIVARAEHAERFESAVKGATKQLLAGITESSKMVGQAHSAATGRIRTDILGIISRMMVVAPEAISGKSIVAPSAGYRFTVRESGRAEVVDVEAAAAYLESIGLGEHVDRSPRISPELLRKIQNKDVQIEVPGIKYSIVQTLAVTDEKKVWQR